MTFANGRVHDLVLEITERTRRRRTPEQAVTGADAGTLKAFVDQQDTARETDAVRPASRTDWLRARNAQLSVLFAALTVSSAALFLFAAVRSARANPEGFGYGLMILSVVAMVVFGLGSLYTSSMSGSKVSTKVWAVIAISLVLGSATAPVLQVERCPQEWAGAPWTADAC